ncbi:MAG: glutathione S-transferase family protein [Myxococcales bacterium]|nr:glutathione S-transferase family protein [Myxococcales bacterium]
MRLHSFIFSPNALKARLALAELGLEHELREVNLMAWEQHSEEFKRLNPHSKVPVLEDGELVLRESNAIVSYLGRKHGLGRFWPKGEAADALAAQWLFFEAVHLAAPLATLVWTERVAPATGLPGSAPEVLQDNSEELTRSLDVLELQLSERPYVLGTEFSLVDCSLGVAATMLLGTRLDQPMRWPRVFEYGERIRSRQSWLGTKGDAFTKFGRPEEARS